MNELEVKRFIDVHVPIFQCNLKCSYCYVGKHQLDNIKPPIFEYDYDTVKKSLTKERLGGICHFNVCGMGETLIPKEIIEYVKVILENGHSVMIVTNGILTDRFEEMMKFPQNLKDRLGFKFSFHFLELKRLNKIDVFFDNVNLARANGCSISVEITANDTYEPYIDEIKDICIKKVGAFCHVSVPRDDGTDEIKLMSKHSFDEFYNIWKTFDSPMFEFKMRHWGENRKEFCYAGAWSGMLNIATGSLISCSCQKGTYQNIFNHTDKKINFCPVGKCKVSHCFNGHSFLTFGTIPSLDEEHYVDIRDRIDINGKHWLNDYMLKQFNCRLSDSNEKKVDLKTYISKYIMFIKNVFRKIYYKILKKENVLW
jgi:organic radical activating enzyme